MQIMTSRHNYYYYFPLRNLMIRSWFPKDLTFQCVVMCRYGGHIHFQGGSGQPGLQPLLQEGNH